MAPKGEYEPPEVGTVFRLRSRYADDAGLDIVKKIASALENRGLISEEMKPVGYVDKLKVRLGEYVNKNPTRKHNRHWIDGGRQVSVINPDTFFPFFFNNPASEICRLCDGSHTVGEIIVLFRKEWTELPEKVLAEDIMKFLLLLEELDLIEFSG